MDDPQRPLRSLIQHEIERLTNLANPTGVEADAHAALAGVLANMERARSLGIVPPGFFHRDDAAPALLEVLR